MTKVLQEKVSYLDAWLSSSPGASDTGLAPSGIPSKSFWTLHTHLFQSSFLLQSLCLQASRSLFILQMPFLVCPNWFS